MVKELSYITLSGVTLPMKLDNLVLQEVQQKYGSLTKFEMDLIGAVVTEDAEGKKSLKQAEPDVSVANFVLPRMIREGFAVLGDTCEYSDDDIIRMIDMNIYVMADTIHEEYRKAMRVQDPKQKPDLKRKKNRSTLIGCIWLAVQSWVTRRKRSIKCTSDV